MREELLGAVSWGSLGPTPICLWQSALGSRLQKLPQLPPRLSARTAFLFFRTFAECKRAGPGVSAASLGPALALGSCHAGGRRHHRSAGNQRAVSVGARPARTGHLLAATGVPGMATRWGIPGSRTIFFFFWRLVRIYFENWVSQACVCG